ncbi:MAG: SRPBCC domain-containing protein [Bacteroidota bacterium]
MTSTIFHCFQIKSDAAKVYEFLTTLDGLSGWWTTDTTGNTYPGGKIRFGFPNGFFDMVEVTESLRNQQVKWVVMESNFPSGHEWIGTEISFEITEDNGCTTVRFTHNNWRAVTDFFGVCNYHWGLYMNSLKSLCETGEGNPQVF